MRDIPKQEIKGAYNTSYGFTKKRKGQVEQFMPFYQSSLEDPSLGYDSPDFNKNIVYKIKGENKSLQYDETSSRARNWYLEASLRYNRKFGSHNVGGLFLYNQSKKYYPAQWVGRLVMFKECLRNNIVPFIVNEQHKFYYYRGLKEYNNEKGYLIDTLLSAQDEYMELLEYFGQI